MSAIDKLSTFSPTCLDFVVSIYQRSSTTRASVGNVNIHVHLRIKKTRNIEQIPGIRVVGGHRIRFNIKKQTCQQQIRRWDSLGF